MLRGWQWLDHNFRADGVPGLQDESGLPPRETSLAYYLHSASRAAVVSGRKRIGSRFWPREIAEQLVRTQAIDGSWGGAYDTCFATLALLNARSPVLINELVTDETEFWNTDPRAAANLTEWISRRFHTSLTWQTLDLTTHPEDIFDAPILLIRGHEAPALSEQQRSKVREFVDGGGTIMAVACCSKSEFTTGCSELFGRLFPQLDSGPLPGDHPIWTIVENVEPGEDCLGFSDVCRTNIFLLTNGACCAWQQNLYDKHERLFTLPANIAAYATFGRLPHGRPRPYFDRTTGTAGQTLTVARLKHRKDWWIAPDALRHLSARLSKRVDLQLDERPAVTARDARNSDAAVLWLTGHAFEPFRAAGRVELKAYLNAGGTLVASACSGSEAFDASFQAFASALYGPDQWRRIEPDDQLMTGAFAPELAKPLIGLQYRERYKAPPPARLDWPILYGIQRDGRWALVYSPHDIHCGVAGLNCLDCIGYRPRDAERIAASILLYAHLGPKPEAEAEPPAGGTPPDTTAPKADGST
jgi:hypothetical protein